MKYTALILLAAILTGCTSDGSFDAAGFGKAVVGYDAAGQPVYR